MNTTRLLQVVMGLIALFFAFGSRKFRLGMVGTKGPEIPLLLGRIVFVAGAVFFFYCALHSKAS
jgi:hypothetical protein